MNMHFTYLNIGFLIWDVVNRNMSSGYLTELSGTSHGIKNVKTFNPPIPIKIYMYLFPQDQLTWSI